LLVIKRGMELSLDEKIYYAHIVLGALMGILCGYMGSGSTVGLLGLAVLFAFWGGLKKALKLDKDNKWWLGNGVWPYVMLWLFVWALVFYIKG